MWRTYIISLHKKRSTLGSRSLWNRPLPVCLSNVLAEKNLSVAGSVNPHDYPHLLLTHQFSQIHHLLVWNGKLSVNCGWVTRRRPELCSALHIPVDTDTCYPLKKKERKKGPSWLYVLECDLHLRWHISTQRRVLRPVWTIYSVSPQQRTMRISSTSRCTSTRGK